jgi:hypothetical protein
MHDYQKSSLWQTAFAETGDGFDKQRIAIAQAYEEFREQVGLLLAKIQQDLPWLTIHDITHVDALWEIASAIAGSGYPLNPAEALVLGGAFLLHDAAHSCAAFSGGLAELMRTSQWRDTVAQRNYCGEELVQGSQAYNDVLFETLRVLHPVRAKTLPFANWPDPAGDGKLFLFPHPDLRNAYGTAIGEVAASHWLDPVELEIFARRELTAPTFLKPATWRVNLLKIAILLRVADAAHIDARRAPKLLLAINKVSDYSREHWEFQQRMHQPSCDIERNELLLSGGPFPPAEQQAWWLAYDSASMIDRELKAADHLLRDHNLNRFAAREVRGGGSPESFATHVQVDGWYPIDASVRITDVKGVVDRFGGAKLYGEKPYLALRELLQNARDAVFAARASGALGANEGKIEIQLEKDGEATWLHVTDTGLGMSRYVLTHVLLDFGRSLWRDSSLKREWPGLAGAGFKPVGRFGIGFFSVFMLGNIVRIITRRQSPAVGEMGDQWVLEFSGGVNHRPLLRPPFEVEKLTRHGTRVSVMLTNPESLLTLEVPGVDILSLMRGHSSRESVTLTLPQLVGALAPTSGVDIFVKDISSNTEQVVKADDWVDLAPQQFIRRIAPAQAEFSSDNAVGEPITFIAGNGERPLGRCGVLEGNRNSFGFGWGIVTIGGLYAGMINNLCGFIEGKQQEKLDRSYSVPAIDSSALISWSEDQAMTLQVKGKLGFGNSNILAALGARCEDLVICLSGNYPVTLRKFRAILAEKNEIYLVYKSELHYHSREDNVLSAEFDQHLSLHSDVYTIDHITVNSFLSESQWPRNIFGDDSPSTISLLQTAINESWAGCTAEDEENWSIGTVLGKPIHRRATVVKRAR